MGRRAYRHGVCVVLRRPGATKVLVCHRVGARPHEGWQFPQGGIEEGRDLLDEARRELREEIGCDGIAVKKTSRRSFCYDIPPKKRRSGSPYVGQCHRWLLAELLDDDSAINFNRSPAEFDAFAWVEVPEALRGVVGFKKKAYAAALAELGLLGRTRQRPSGILSGRGTTVDNNPRQKT
jgi:putative (di)nucleoside polyphosphate hydrolase